MTKMTRKDTFEAIRTYLENTIEDADTLEYFVDFLNHEIEKTQRTHAPSKVQKENAIIKEEIMNYFAETGREETATQVWTNGFSGYSMQKIVQLLSQLVREDKLIRTKAGRIVTFSLPAID